MMQYRCEGDDGTGSGSRGGVGGNVGRWKKDGIVRCWEVERLFRRYGPLDFAFSCSESL
jgi:hypothetical protein